MVASLLCHHCEFSHLSGRVKYRVDMLLRQYWLLGQNVGFCLIGLGRHGRLSALGYSLICHIRHGLSDISGAHMWVDLFPMKGSRLRVLLMLVNWLRCYLGGFLLEIMDFGAASRFLGTYFGFPLHHLFLCDYRAWARRACVVDENGIALGFCRSCSGCTRCVGVTAANQGCKLVLGFGSLLLLQGLQLRVVRLLLRASFLDLSLDLVVVGVEVARTHGVCD